MTIYNSGVIRNYRGIGWKGRPIDKVDIKVSITTDQGTFDVTNLVEESAWCEMTDRLFETFAQIQKEESI